MRKISYITLLFFFSTVILALMLLLPKLNSKKEEHYDSSMVLNKIAHIQELATIKYNYAGVIGYKDAMKVMNVKIPLTEKHFLIKYNGYLKAGVDFNRINVSVDGESVHVSMPKARLFDVVIDENSVNVYNESDNAFNPIKIADYNNALMKEKETMKQDAIRQGILKDANQHAELVVRMMLQEMGFKQINITTEIVIPDVH